MAVCYTCIAKEGAMIAVRVPEEIETRLERLAQLTGRTKTYYVREAIENHLDDLEEAYLAEKVLDKVRSGREKLIPLEDVVKQYGLDD
jgi:RHH-type rel operon transcriptional repressor/antitoxin RelB